MRGRSIRYGLVIFFLAASLCAASERFGPEYALRLWTVEDRLPALPLTGLAQSRCGYIWLSTVDRLIRFNGFDFVSLTVPAEVLADTGALGGVACGEPEGIWFFGDRGVGRFDRGAWESWSAEGDSAVLGRILGLVISRQGIVRAYAERGLWEAVTADDDSSTRFQVRGCPVPSDDRATLGAVTDADVDDGGRIWMTAWNGLVEYAEGRFDDKSTRVPDFLVEAVSGVHAGRSNRLWITGPYGIAYFENNLWTPIGFPENAGLASGMLELSDGSLWIGNPTGIYRWSGGEWTHIGDGEIPAAMAVRKIIEDADGTVWAACDGGLLNIRRKLVGRMHSDGMVTEGTAYSFCVLPDEKIWAGYKGHAVRLDPASGRILQTVYLDVDLPVSAVLQDTRGTVWMGTPGGGLFRSSGAAYPAFVPHRDYSRPVTHTIYALLEDPDLGVLAGTPQGLMRISELGELESASVRGDIYTGSVRGLFRDRAGTLWICSDNSGAIGYLPDGGKTVLDEAKGLRGYARCVYRDSADRLWVGSTAGLFAMHAGHLYSVGAKAVELDQSVVQISEDSYGRIWVGARNGLLSLSFKSIDSIASSSELDYTRGIGILKLEVADGLPGERALGGAGFSAGIQEPGVFASRLLFTFEGGICLVDPSRFEPSEKAPQVEIERVVANADVLADNIGGDLRDLIFKPGVRTVSFHFTALSPAEQGSVFYRHRVSGLHEGWSPVQRERTAAFEWIPPGKYTFELVAGKGGLWSESSVALGFEVQAYFWQTTWFYILLTAGLAGIVFAVARAIVNQRYKMQMEMMRREEALHQERARISRDIHDDLGNGLSVVATLSELTHNDVEKESAHRRLDQIYDVANELARNVDEIVWAVNPVNDSWEPFISYFEQYTEYFLGHSALRFHFVRPPELSDVKVASKTRHHLLLAVREAVGNILKHADARQVNIAMSISEGVLTIDVADDGRGFNPAEVEGIGHNGLLNMQRRMKEIGGFFAVDSAPGRGTRLKFQVKL